MGLRQLHRWLGVFFGGLAVVLGITGSLLAVDPLRNAWQATTPNPDVPLSQVVHQIQGSVQGIEEIRRFPSGTLVVQAFDGNQAVALRVDPRDGHVLGNYQPSWLPHWVKNLHRSLLSGDGGRATTALVSLAMLALAVTGLVILARRMGGWRRLSGSVRGNGVQRLHTWLGRTAMVFLGISSAAAVFLSAVSLELINFQDADEPRVTSTSSQLSALTASQLPLLKALRVSDLRKLTPPAIDDPEDTWRLSTTQGQAWIDQFSGETLAWQEASPAQNLLQTAQLLHTGEGAWGWAVILLGLGASIPLFWITGFVHWRKSFRPSAGIADNSPIGKADSLVFVASENGSTWHFAHALRHALVEAGHVVHTSQLEQWQVPPSARHVYILASTYGEGQPPSHAAGALNQIKRHPPTHAQVAVLGFGDRQFPAFCAFAAEVDGTLNGIGWKTLTPFERIHQQSAQEFTRWAQHLSDVLGHALLVDYQPPLPRTSALTLIHREDFSWSPDEAAVILRFALPKKGLKRFFAGDLLAIAPPGLPTAPRTYSLASATRDGFVEICVRRMAGGICSNYLHGLKLGEQVQGFIRSNPGFVLPWSHRPALLIGAGTGVAPLAGFIRGSGHLRPLHLYYGTRDPESDFFFGNQLKAWQVEGRLADLQTTFSRTPDGGGYVQEAFKRDAHKVRHLLMQGAVVRVCGSHSMAQSVTQVLNEILTGLGMSVTQLKRRERYAEDLF